MPEAMLPAVWSACGRTGAFRQMARGQGHGARTSLRAAALAVGARFDLGIREQLLKMIEEGAYTALAVRRRTRIGPPSLS